MFSLQDKRVVITRAKVQADSLANKLTQLGAQPILFPTIEIRPLADYSHLDAALKNLDHYDWLILTSVNVVQVVLDRFNNLNINHLPSKLRTACIGPKTAEAFEQQGFRTDFIPEKYVAEYIFPGLAPINGKKYLLPQADIARKFLAETIRDLGGIIDHLTAYRTLPAAPTDITVAELRAGVDVIAFTSPSTALNFASIVKKTGLDLHRLPGNPIFVCIGPITADAIKEMEMPVAVMPNEYTVDGLLEALIQYYNGEK